MRSQSPRTILGVDPGTGRCGWAVVQIKNLKLKIKNSSSIELVDCGVIETPAKTPLPERLQVIFEKISDLIKKHQVGEMAIEELFFVKNIKTGISVSHARGVIMLAGRLAGAEISEYKPNEVKLAIAGYGHATKEAMVKMVKLHLKGCEASQDDTVDAIAIGLYHLQIANSKLKM
jgi:crossover junction endodeoxyribonuclease RuvC